MISSATACASGFPLLALITSAAPVSASANAVSRPIRRELPVTIATRPSRGFWLRGICLPSHPPSRRRELHPAQGRGDDEAQHDQHDDGGKDTSRVETPGPRFDEISDAAVGRENLA